MTAPARNSGADKMFTPFVIGHTLTPYTSSKGGGICLIDKRCEEEKTQRFEVIHTVPNMTEAERESATKRIGNDLYEVILRIKETLEI